MSKKIANQKQKNASVTEMDAGKFLRMINSGARSQIVLFEERIRAMGQQAGANWHLVSLDNKSLVFEDVDSHKYFTADIARLSRGRVKIDKVQEVRVVESKKEESFHKNLKELIDNISEDNSRQADSIFNRIAAQRFRSKVIPESNRVTTRDGITRHVNVARTIISDSLKPRIIRAVCEALTDSIRTKRGRVVEATFADRDFEFPISELTRRRVVARKMKQIAGNAYLSEGFQSRVQHICGLVCKKEIKEAVKIAAEFLAEEQEFSLLNLTETKELIGFTLAAQGILNEDLSKDVGLLFYSTNCKINRETIINDWKETARMTEYAPLVENVRRLEGSENFDKDYQSFLRMVFKEDMTTKQAKAKMYLAALKEMKHVLSGGPDQDLVEGLDEFIVRLESAGDEVDDATLMEVEAMVAATSENLLKNVDDLSSFRDIPGEPPGGDLGPEFGDADLSDEAGLGGLGGGGMGGGDMGGGPELPLGDEEGLGEEGLEGEGGEEDLLSGEGEEGELSDEDEFGFSDQEDELLAASDQKRGQKPILEGKCKGCGANCEDDTLCECGYTESKDDDAECESRVAIGGVVESKLRRAVKKLNSKQLAMEFNVWKKGAGKFFAEDGAGPCTVQLTAYIDRARYLKSKPLFEGFKRILIANTPVETTAAVSSDPYAYKGGATKIDREYGLAEDHKTWPDKMKQSKEGGQIGSKETARSKGDAMGSQEKETDHLQTMKGGIPPNQNKKKTGMEGFVRCTDCEGMYDITECMTRDGAVCPECGSDMHNQLMEELSGAGHQMDRISGDGGGVAATSLGTSDGCKAGGTKDKAGGQEGKGIAAKGLTKSDGRKAGGTKDKMGGQEGSTVSGSGNSGKVKGLTEGEKGFCKECGKPKAICGCSDADEGGNEGEVEEDQYKDPTRRRRYAWPNKGRDTINKTEAESRKRKGKKLDEGQTVVLVTDDPVDQVVSNIASQMTGMGGDEMGDMGDEMGDEMDLVGGEEMPPDDDEFGTMGDEEGGEGEDFEDMGDEFGGEGDVEGAEGDEGALSDDDEFGSEGGEGGEDEGGEGPPFEGGAGDDEGGEEEEEVEEGTLPPALEKYKKKKGGDDSDNNDNSEPVDEDEECCPDCGCAQGECTCAVKEDNNITTPTTKEYDSETAARNDGDGKAMTKKPKFKETDVAGRKNIGPARSAGG